jgi:hypothetical protein
LASFLNGHEKGEKKRKKRKKDKKECPTTSPKSYAFHLPHSVTATQYAHKKIHPIATP